MGLVNRSRGLEGVPKARCAIVMLITADRKSWEPGISALLPSNKSMHHCSFERFMLFVSEDLPNRDFSLPDQGNSRESGL